MAKLLFITVPTDEVTYNSDKLREKYGPIRFPGTEKAVEELTEAGWDVEVVDPTWPNPLKAAEKHKPAAALVSTYKAVPRSRDAASMLARMTDLPVYTVGVTQKDEAFETMAPTVTTLQFVGDLPSADEVAVRDPEAGD